ncbi:alkaline phosphatase family protein [Archangium sp.]|uniref:alkaline phosphatase family protein n=1 Tax=Archangium sp. TaxID=1872627 RepID=UPI003899A1F7
MRVGRQGPRSLLALLMVAGLLAGERTEASEAPAPSASASDIQHIVVVMMENRSFDHLVGWTPGADGRQAGLAYPDRLGVLQPTYPLAPDYQGCGHPDPDHSYEGGRVEYDGGACDGWLRAGTNDAFAIGYYRQENLPFLGRAVPRWTTFDRYFSAIMAETYPNRIYQHAAQTDRLTNTFELSTLPTLWDRLAEKGVTGRYYYTDVPFLALWGPRYLPIGRPLVSFLVDAATGHLPQVSFVDPRFLGEEQGVSGDDHPHGDIRNGEVFLSLVYNAVTQGPAWKNTVLIINFDEWGGFYDHVPPPTAPIPPADQLAGNADGRLGFRTPALLIAPWARQGAVSHTQFDHTSVLRFIEWRWGLEPLTVRDATANNLVEALDFTQPPRRAPLLLVPPLPYGLPCAPGGPPPDADLEKLEDLAHQYGWPVYRWPTASTPLTP